MEIINKEYISTLPRLQYEGRILLIENENQLASACRQLRKEPYLGFDTETRPSFKKGTQHPVALLQLAAEDYVVLIRVNKVPLHEDLCDLLADETIIKAGVAVRDDLRALQKRSNFTPASVIDLANMARERGLQEQGLRTITARLFGKSLCKASRCSNWERKELSPQQVTYAATDAWVSRKIYTSLLEMPVQ